MKAERANYKTEIAESIGKKFGMLTVLKHLEPRANRAYVEVRCDCGTVKAVGWSNLKRKNTVSCGCYRKVAVKKGWGKFHTKRFL